MKRERSPREREREDGPLPVTRTRILSFGREEKSGGGQRRVMAESTSGGVESAADADARTRTERFVDRSLAKDPKVKFLLEALKTSGCSVNSENVDSFFRVEKCEAEIAGGFRPQQGVVVCQNHVQTQEEVNNLLAHELIHAYDHCRAANLDWNNCQHHTCSEVSNKRKQTSQENPSFSLLSSPS